MEKSTTFIYGLVSTKDLTNVRYVGKTVQRLSNRLYEHLQCHKGKNTHKQSWIKQQQNLGYSIKIILIDEVWTEDWEFWEMFWIQEYFRRGYKLTNLAPGGNQPNNTEEIYVINSNNEIMNTFNSISEAARYYGIAGSRISRVLNNKKRDKTVKGLVFVKPSNYNKNQNYGLLFIRKPSNIPVYQYKLDGSFIKKWKNQKEVSKCTGISMSGLNCALRGRQHSSGGFQWSYILEDKSSRIIDYKSKISIYKDEILIDTYESIADMCRAFNFDIKYVYRSIYERKTNKYKGYTFKRLDKI